MVRDHAFTQVSIGGSRTRRFNLAGAGGAGSGSTFRCRSGLSLLLLIIMGAVTALTGCGEKPDPVDEIRALVPKLQEALNARNIGGLRRLGTGNFEANRFIIDAFQGGAEGRISLEFQRVKLHPEGTELNITARLDTDTGPGEGRDLTVYLEGNGRWRVDSYTFVVATGEETASDTLMGDST